MFVIVAAAPRRFAALSPACPTNRLSSTEKQKDAPKSVLQARLRYLPARLHLEISATATVNPDTIVIEAVSPIQVAARVAALAHHANATVLSDAAVITTHIVGSAVNGRHAATAAVPIVITVVIPVIVAIMTTVPSIADGEYGEVRPASAIDPNLVPARSPCAAFTATCVASLTK